MEIPDLNIPHINDNTIEVENSSSKLENSIHFGTPSIGSETVWQDMMSSTEAELSTTSNYNDNEEQLLPSTKVFTEQVIGHLEKERSKASFSARSKKTHGSLTTPIVRARMEPITVSFTMSNPLGFSVPISSLQLVAKLKCAATGRIYTNAEAIHVPFKDETKRSKNKKWNFNCSDEAFEVANFTQLSSSEAENNKSWTVPGKQEDKPFFVVTKKATLLDGMSKEVTILSFCPLIMGDLEIVGVRCKIFNEIWVSHPFSVLGPILQKIHSIEETEVIWNCIFSAFLLLFHLSLHSWIYYLS